MTTNNHESSERAARYAQHVAALCVAFRVALRVDPVMRPDQAGMGYLNGDPRHPFIRITPVIDESTYAVALHEIGHCLHPLGTLHEQCSKHMQATNTFSTARDVRLQLDCERAAWEWAHAYALEWTDLMTSVERYALGSYERRAKQILGRV